MVISQNAVASEKKIECFCLDPNNRVVYVGTVGGVLAGYSTLDLSLLFEVTAHAGIIAAIAYHRALGLLACLSADNTVSVWKPKPERTPRFMCRIPLWNLQPSNDERVIADFQSESQALAFHDWLPRIATRTGNGALLEIDVDDFGTYRYVHCIRLFEAADLTCVRYVPSSDLLLAGSIGGQLGLVFNGVVIENIATGGSNIHWIEPISNSEFLLASDSRQVVRISLYTLDAPLIGPKFCRDDLEHVALSADGKTAYAGSFDRKIYRIDAQTCEATDIAFHAPFKCRWVRPLPKDDDHLVVQTRDGGLHLVDVSSKTAIRTIRETPSAIWTCDRRDVDRFYFAGEPDSVLTLDLRSGRTSVVSIAPFSCGDQVYTKRLIALNNGRGCLLGRTDGHVLRIENDEVLGSVDVGAAVRDICRGPADTAFVALEDGRVIGIDATNLELRKIFVSPLGEPIWSLAFNGVSTLAVAERGGRLRMLSSDTLEQISEHSRMTRPKRMAWQNGKRLLFGWSDQLRAFTLDDGREEIIIDSIGNTIEDFIVHSEYGYVVFISYMRNIYLARLATGEILCVAPDCVDYSKGVAWTNPSTSIRTDGAPEFMTYGRHGAINYYRIVNEKIHPWGRIALPDAMVQPKRSAAGAVELRRPYAELAGV
jgi:WD40 repeat protein